MTPHASKVNESLLGGVLRDKFKAGLASTTGPPLNHYAKFTIVGVKHADYTKRMKLVRHHIARGWKISWVESKKQLYTLWTPDPQRELG